MMVDCQSKQRGKDGFGGWEGEIGLW